MELNPSQLVTKFAHMMQQELFPLLERVVGPLSKELGLLSSVVALIPLEGTIATLKAGTGRPGKDRAAIATAFMAKTILNLPTTRALLSRLGSDEAPPVLRLGQSRSRSA